MEKQNRTILDIELEQALRDAFSDLLGAKVLEIEKDAVWGGYKIKIERVDISKFRELAKKYSYSQGYFTISLVQALPVLKELEGKGILPNEGGLASKWSLREAEKRAKYNEEIEKKAAELKKKVEGLLNASVLSLEHHLEEEYVSVKLERLELARFKELANRYRYSNGWFKIPLKDLGIEEPMSVPEILSSR
ncbi:hypothetical protein DMB44_04195 [Thermoplasma sp. Kam2015]|uniref:hypothetical protein n=1 Tax=Thermoplasma sp. Kam2015 TaxID=2094122 RepID=UPI000D931AFA|nr:hypothetical protein [Thermoplasma sp. Kam2015]PYB68541.1 hypothetical protein DMB44_04195 [Thermoplasma sp. Kam2015]